MQQLIRGFREVEQSMLTCLARVKTIDKQFAEVCTDLKAGQSAMKDEVFATLNE